MNQLQEKVPISSWVKVCCKCHEEFAGHVFSWGPPDERQRALFLFSVQKPYSIHFQSLQEVSEVVVINENLTPEQAHASPEVHWDHSFYKCSFYQTSVISRRKTSWCMLPPNFSNTTWLSPMHRLFCSRNSASTWRSLLERRRLFRPNPRKSNLQEPL